MGDSVAEIHIQNQHRIHLLSGLTGKVAAKTWAGSSKLVMWRAKSILHGIFLSLLSQPRQQPPRLRFHPFSPSWNRKCRWWPSLVGHSSRRFAFFSKAEWLAFIFSSHNSGVSFSWRVLKISAEAEAEAARGEIRREKITRDPRLLLVPY